MELSRLDVSGSVTL